MDLISQRWGQRQEEPWVSLASQCSLVCVPQIPVRDPVSENKGVTAEAQHPSSISDLHMLVHTHALTTPQYTHTTYTYTINKHFFRKQTSIVERLLKKKCFPWSWKDGSAWRIPVLPEAQFHFQHSQLSVIPASENLTCFFGLYGSSNIYVNKNKINIFQN